MEEANCKKADNLTDSEPPVSFVAITDARLCAGQRGRKRRDEAESLLSGFLNQLTPSGSP